jgi:hypothetical protein
MYKPSKKKETPPEQSLGGVAYDITQESITMEAVLPVVLKFFVN